MTKRAVPLLRTSLLVLPLLAAMALSGCERKASEQSRRIDQLELKIQQLETRINQVSTQVRQPEKDGRLPKGAIKSLTYRTTDAGNRLRIYWADGSQTDLECNQEQATLACG
jgi:septal ring factor EnvC (AmiA/AmiB activator)